MPTFQVDALFFFKAKVKLGAKIIQLKASTMHAVWAHSSWRWNHVEFDLPLICLIVAIQQFHSSNPLSQLRHSSNPLSQLRHQSEAVMTICMASFIFSSLFLCPGYRWWSHFSGMLGAPEMLCYC